MHDMLGENFSRKHFEIVFLFCPELESPAEFAITKTYLYNFDPLKPRFYIVTLEFTGVYIIFLFLLKNIDCGLVRTASPSRF